MSMRGPIPVSHIPKVMTQALLDRVQDVLLNPSDDESTEDSKAERQFILASYTLQNIKSSQTPVVFRRGIPMISQESLVAAHAAPGHGSRWEDMAERLPSYAPRDFIQDYVNACAMCAKRALKIMASSSKSPDKGKAKQITSPPSPPSSPEVVELASSPTQMSSPKRSKKVTFCDPDVPFPDRARRSSLPTSSSLPTAISPATTSTPVYRRKSSGTVLLAHNSPETYRPPLPFHNLKLPPHPRPTGIHAPFPPLGPPSSIKRKRGKTVSVFDQDSPTRLPLKKQATLPSLASVTGSALPARPAPLSIRRYTIDRPIIYLKYQGLPDGWQYCFGFYEHAQKAFGAKTAAEGAAIGNALAPKQGRTALPRIVKDAPNDAWLPTLHHSILPTDRLSLVLQSKMINRPQTTKEKQKSRVAVYDPLADIFTSFDATRDGERQPVSEDERSDILDDIAPMNEHSVFERDEERGWIILPEVKIPDPPVGPVRDPGGGIVIPPLVLDNVITAGVGAFVGGVSSVAGPSTRAA